MNGFTLPGTDGIFINGCLYSKKKLCIDWFRMSNDSFLSYTVSTSIHINIQVCMNGEENTCMESDEE